MQVDLDILTQELRMMISKVVEKKPEAITDEILFSDLGADSIMMLEIMVATERKYKIMIPQEYLPKMVNLKETISVIRTLQG